MKKIIGTRWDILTDKVIRTVENGRKHLDRFNSQRRKKTKEGEVK
jgi:hypothetical protein